MALRTRCRSLVFSRVLDQFDHRDRLPDIVLDLPEIERGRVAVERGVAAQSAVLEYALKFVRSGDHGVPKGRGELSEGFAVEPVHGKVDAETLFGAVNELLAEGGAYIDIGDALAVT